MYRSTCTYNSQLNYMINEYKIEGYYIIKYLMSKHTFKGRNYVIKIIFLSREMAFGRAKLRRMRSGSRPDLSNAQIKTLTGN